jgi:hypothetical protein
MKTLTLIALLIVTVSLDWVDTNDSEDGTIIFREIAGAYQPVGQVGPDVTTFSETFSASEGAQLPYKVQVFRGEELAPFSNERVGIVPGPCRQKGKSNNCR